MLVSVTQTVLFELTNHKHSDCTNDKTSNVSKTGTMRSVPVTIVAVEKGKNVTFCECVFVALFIQHAKRMRRVIL